MNSDKDIVITSAFRTPIGSFQGSLKDHKATELGTAVVKKCMEHSNLNGSEVFLLYVACDELHYYYLTDLIILINS